MSKKQPSTTSRSKSKIVTPPPHKQRKILPKKVVSPFLTVLGNAFEIVIDNLGLKDLAHLRNVNKQTKIFCDMSEEYWKRVTTLFVKEHLGYSEYERPKQATWKTWFQELKEKQAMPFAIIRTPRFWPCGAYRKFISISSTGILADFITEKQEEASHMEKCAFCKGKEYPAEHKFYLSALVGDGKDNFYPIQIGTKPTMLYFGGYQCSETTLYFINIDTCAIGFNTDSNTCVGGYAPTEENKRAVPKFIRFG
jgi:hypothetical protein